MSLQTYVYWGTDAGWKTQKPKPTKRWLCECVDYYLGQPDQRSNPPYLKNCPDCWTRRPY